jgi:sulfur-oxidizing protein SoxY
MPQTSALSRRTALLLGAGALAAMVAPHLVLASEAQVAAEIKRLIGGKSPSPGKIKLDVPQIAENGLIVPVSVEVDSPMTEADHVRAIHIFADGNPLPGVVSYQLTPSAGKAAVSLRIRLAQTQNVICLAEMSNGNLHIAKSEVKVTIGGCGG